jgi:hypothetical protein
MGTFDMLKENAGIEGELEDIFIKLTAGANNSALY